MLEILEYHYWDTPCCRQCARNPWVLKIGMKIAWNPRAPYMGEGRQMWKIIWPPIRTYIYYYAEIKLENLKTDIYTCMLQCFRKRFINTADIIISKLAYYLTPVGVFNFRSQSKFQKATLMNQLKKNLWKLHQNIL